MSFSRFYIFFFSDTPTTEIYTLSLHDALPICGALDQHTVVFEPRLRLCERIVFVAIAAAAIVEVGHQRVELLDFFALVRSEEHTSELQSRRDLVCRLLLEKKKNTKQLI